MEYILLPILLGLLPACIAQHKGRSFVGWWIFGALLFIVALPAILLVKKVRHNQKQCAYCAEWIASQAIICPHCRSSQLPASVPSITAGAD